MRLSLARRDFVGYVDYAHHQKAFRHHQEWAYAFENESANRPNTLIIAPPAHAKTTWSSVFLPCYLLGRNPGLHIGILGAAARQAYKQSVAVRDHIDQSPEFHAVFPAVRLDRSKGKARDQWYLKRPRVDDKDPSMIAAGLDGGVLGSRLDYLIVDDLMNEATANSATLRTSCRNWFRNTAMTRVLGGNPGRVIMLLTRWPGVTDDLAEEVMHDPFWNVIHMPAVGYWGDGGALWPEQVSLEFLLNEQARSESTYEAVYQGNPKLRTGNLFKRDWWTYADEEVWPSRFEKLIQVWDTAFKDKKTSDYSACVTLGLWKGNIFVLNVFEDKLTWPDLMPAVNRQYAGYRPSIVLVEDSASGQNVIQALKVQSDPMIPVQEALRGQQDKRSFAEPITGFVSGGRVVLPKGVSWTRDFVNSMADFDPKKESQKDDDVMAFLHGMRWLTKSKSIALTDDCIIIGSQQSEFAGMNLPRVGSTILSGMPGGMVGGQHWFDAM